MSSALPIKRRRGDTRRIVFKVVDSNDTIVDISGWTALKLTVDPVVDPTDATNNVFQVNGSLVTDGLDGRLKFIPPGTSNAGDYYYDAQAIDENSEKITFAHGSYALSQDITKD